MCASEGVFRSVVNVPTSTCLRSLSVRMRGQESLSVSESPIRQIVVWLNLVHRGFSWAVGAKRAWWLFSGCLAGCVAVGVRGGVWLVGPESWG